MILKKIITLLITVDLFLIFFSLYLAYEYKKRQEEAINDIKHVIKQLKKLS